MKMTQEPQVVVFTSSPKLILPCHRRNGSPYVNISRLDLHVRYMVNFINTSIYLSKFITIWRSFREIIKYVIRNSQNKLMSFSIEMPSDYWLLTNEGQGGLLSETFKCSLFKYASKIGQRFGMRLSKLSGMYSLVLKQVTVSCVVKVGAK